MFSYGTTVKTYCFIYMLHENCEIGLVVYIIKQNENKSAH